MYDFDDFFVSCGSGKRGVFGRVENLYVRGGK